MVVELSNGSLDENLLEFPWSVLDVVVVFKFGDVVVDSFVVYLVEADDGSTLVVVVIIVGGTSVVVGSSLIARILFINDRITDADNSYHELP